MSPDAGQVSASQQGQLDTIKAGYSFTEPALDLGAAVIDGTAHPDVPVRIPLAVMNRHGLVAGATGTGKTKTLQVLADLLTDLPRSEERRVVKECRSRWASYH